jgi:hypothetical protein
LEVYPLLKYHLKKVYSIAEVVVTATGIRKDAREIGYSYANVKSDDVVNGRSPQLAQALSGKVAGLAVYNVNNSVRPSGKNSFKRISITDRN